MKPRTIIIDGKQYAWRDIIALRRAQLAAAREVTQPRLFEMVEDHRPASQKTAAGRLCEPTLFS